MRTKEQTLEFLLEDRIKFGTVSGIFTTKPNLIEWVDLNILDCELISSKSYQVKPNKGNRESIIVEASVGCFGNAVGLRNPGMEKGHNDLVELRKRHNLRSYLNVSLSANSIDDFVLLVCGFEDIAEILELNFSCPHAKQGFGSSIGSSAKIVKEYMKEIRQVTKALLFPKLTPNVDNIGEIAIAAMEGGADGISAINTVGPEVYIEPHTGKPILYNPNGHKGGKSGEWIKDIAIKKIEEIRQAIGKGIPIIGMGGITIGEDVRRMRDAGANVIGIGSVFARIPKGLRPSYVATLKEDAKNGTNNASKFISKERVAEYKPYKITSIKSKSEDLKVFELEGRIEYKPSQFAYLWVPDVGEKPFSIAKNNPLTFLIRKRDYDPDNKKGLVTHALFQLKKGDELMIRKIYGADAPDSKKSNTYVVAGGTGIAVVPKLVEKLSKQGKNITVYYGITSEEQIVFEDTIKKYAKYIPVADNGVVARVLEVMKNNLKKNNLDDACFYNIGPIPLMKEAMVVQEKMGANAKDIFASIETNNMCGLGICGECECGGKLTCQEGTFFSLDYLKSKNIDIMQLENY